MARVLAVIQPADKSAPAEATKSKEDTTSDDVGISTEFHNFIFDELWDTDLELESTQDDDVEFAFNYGYINALRKVALTIFEYSKDTLDKWTPNYLQYDNESE